MLADGERCALTLMVNHSFWWTPLMRWIHHILRKPLCGYRPFVDLVPPSRALVQPDLDLDHLPPSERT